MKKLKGFLAVALLVSGLSLVSCSSKEKRMDETAFSSDAGQSESTESANLGASSSGMGR